MPRENEACEFDEIIWTRLNEGEDLLKAIWEIAATREIRAGIVLEGTGALQNVVFQHFPKNCYTCRLPLDVYEINGPLQTNVRGIIGVTVQGDAEIKSIPLDMVPNVIESEKDKWNFIGSQGGLGTPYFQGHFSAINKDVSVMGRLLPGSKIENPGMGRNNKPTHFTLVIGKVKGIEFQMKMNKNGFAHEIVKL
ncbi:MAG TPA: DUF296 domain-containing protein [Syntrophomonas sp.]|nr:DUF296 domain-containing protein [Syntrophomonas sp.]